MERLKTVILVVVVSLLVNASMVVGAGWIGSGDIKDGGVHKNDIGKMAVTKTKIKTGAVNKYKLATGAVNTYKILDGTIQGRDIASHTITSDKLISDPSEKYISFAGAAFHETWMYGRNYYGTKYSSDGLMYLPAGAYAAAPVQLPDGAKITYFAARITGQSNRGEIRLKHVKNSGSETLFSLSNPNDVMQTVELRPASPHTVDRNLSSRLKQPL